MSNTRSNLRTPSPPLEAPPPAYSPPQPSASPPSPLKKTLPIIIIPDSKSVASTSTTSSQGIAPYRGAFYPPPPIPGSSFHVRPHDGRPRDDMPYESPRPMADSPGGFSRPSTAGRTQTMYFDANKANRQSYMSYDSRMEKQEEKGTEKKGCWSFTCCWYFCLCCT